MAKPLLTDDDNRLLCDLQQVLQVMVLSVCYDLPVLLRKW